MKNFIAIVCALGFAVAIGCGGGDGGDKKLSEFSDAEAKELCEYVNDNLIPAATCQYMGQEVMLEAMTPLDCSTAVAGDTPSSCTATEGDFKDCWETLNADPCLLLEEAPPPECAEIFSAACQSDSARRIRGWFPNVVSF